VTIALFLLGAGAGAFFLRAWLLEADPAQQLVQTGLLWASGLLVLAGLVQTIVHEFTRREYRF
jgi:formate-dependent nitrite reductase membrane component NrfD